MSTETLQTALRMLARREHSCFELRQKLQQKGHSPEAIVQTLDKLLQDNYLNEERFTESYIRSRSNKGYGSLRISAELKEKGISKELIAQFIKNQNGKISTEEIRAKKFGTALPQNAADRAKQIRYLQYKGFNWEEIKKIFNAKTLD